MNQFLKGVKNDALQVNTTLSPVIARESSSKNPDVQRITELCGFLKGEKKVLDHFYLVINIRHIEHQRHHNALWSI
jgi:hypothetical protein